LQTFEIVLEVINQIFGKMFETCFEIFLSLFPISILSFAEIRWPKRRREVLKKKGKQAKRPNQTRAAHLAHPSSCRHRPCTVAHPALHVAMAAMGWLKARIPEL
jgi:hypothetical protein